MSESGHKIVYADLSMFVPPELMTDEAIDKLNSIRTVENEEIISVLKRKVSQTFDAGTTSTDSSVPNLDGRPVE
jgi:hypothetical protein